MAWHHIGSLKIRIKAGERGVIVLSNNSTPLNTDMQVTGLPPSAAFQATDPRLMPTVEQPKITGVTETIIG